jgi:hypothetical protein
MKKIYLVHFIFFYIQISAQYTTIPDEDFEQELINQGIDSDGILNHLVLNSDINTVLSLNITASNLHNIIGIEGFTQLQSISIRNCYNLTNLNFSSNLNLIAIYCDSNSLTSINVSNNILLQVLNCGGNQLTALDISNNINLIAVYCNFNSLTSLNVSNNIALQGLYCRANQLTTLDVSNNINLSDLACPNNLLTTLDVSQNVNLTQLYCYYNLLTTLNIYANPALLIVSCGYNLLTNLTITNTPQLIRIHCVNNRLTTLDLYNLPLLKDLFCQNNLLTTLDFSYNPALKGVFCYNNNITTLNLNNNPLIDKLHCNNNNLSTLLLQNGTNTLLNGVWVTNPGGDPLVYDQRFNATNNPNLSCIFVDDVANCNTNWVAKDITSHYVSTQQECDNLQNEEFITNSFTVYPNPVNDILFIENNNNNIIQEIVVYDVMGKTVIEQNGSIAQIDFSNITNGLYLVKITSEKEIIVKKIMKK